LMAHRVETWHSPLAFAAQKLPTSGNAGPPGTVLDEQAQTSAPTNPAAPPNPSHVRILFFSL
jgi:hypothetical protein